MADWLTIRRGAAPLVVSLPHTGTEIPEDCQTGLVSLWLARRDADWWIDTLYDFAAEMDATVVHTAISRTVIDVNRDPSGVSLYPGQATTELCPTTTFDGELLYEEGREPSTEEIERRKARYHAPYHEALKVEIARLRAIHPTVVVYDCHSIRSRIPRLFEGELPVFNIGTNSGLSCAPDLQARIEAITAASGFPSVSNGRFKGGYITRSLGAPEAGIHTVQMELACRAYMPEPESMPTPETWPTPYDAAYADPLRENLKAILTACLGFAEA
ncbi:formiminoglutamase [Fulvimarina manganoxydans]|uniref:Formiminoglutamase n=1 Tax=Fulvimarina manganoxydans TaxID=937218 RepID=A0A1W1YB41_9HYPH|nr:N-formylglutamate deformylase [Fulvimarina manganoxydans]SMC33430.1 formiminoglutamase [Fulvimarina manganoxydans]